MILDTDTFNEVDDQFALSWAALDTDRFTLEAVTAAPFSNELADTPGRGMELSYEEIGRVLELCKRTDIPAYRGSTQYLADMQTPVKSDAVDQIIERSKSGHLWVVAIGAITNVASALLADPTLKDRLSVAWLGAHSSIHETHWEFNHQQDIKASKVVFESGVELAWFPCGGASSHLLTTTMELKSEVGGNNPLCDFLIDRFHDHVGDANWQSKVLWDLAPLVWLGGVENGGTYRSTDRPIWNDVKPPMMRDDARGTPCLEALTFNRDAVFRAVFDVIGRKELQSN